nr:hypothetical protein [Rhodococcus sp. (in: high G+C Gram-positive bacteria)]
MAFPLQFMRVTGNISALVPDYQGPNGSAVPDGVPDSVPLSGKVEFTLNIDEGDYVLTPNNPDGPSIKVVAPTLCTLDVDGDLTYNGRKYVELFAPDQWTYPQSARYTVRFIDLKRGTVPVSIRQFNIEAVPGGVIDLSSVARVPGTQSAPVIVGPPGASVQAVRLDGDNLIFSVNNGVGDLPAIPLLGLGDLDQYVVDTLAAADEALVSRNESAYFSGISNQKADASQGSADAAALSAVAAAGSATTADQARSAAQGFRDTASGHATAAGTARTAAETAKTAAETAKTQAETARNTAQGHVTTASGHATTAGTKAGEAAGSATAAAGSATTAGAKASEAAASAVTAKSEADRASNYVGGVADNTVSTAKIQNDAVTLAKIPVSARAEVARRVEGYEWWHDVLAFGVKVPFPSFESRSAGTWSAGTVDNRLFAQLEGTTVNVIPTDSAIEAVRFTWNANNLNYCLARYMMVGVSYAGTSRMVQYDVERSNDGVTWEAVASATSGGSSETQLIEFPSTWGGHTWMRLTATRISGTGNLGLTTIRALTNRKGDQGGGSEFSFPYDWDANRRMTIQSLRLPNGAPTTAKVLLSSNSSGDAAWGQVSAGHIADTAVTLAKLAANSVDSSKIVDGSIVDADINATAAIAQSKVAGLTTALDSKVPLVSTINVAYANNGSGVATPLAFTSAATPSTLAFRTTGGVVSVGTPTADSHATPRKYVEDALLLKAAASHTHTKADVGLGSVDNTADSAKPVSAAQQTALNAKADTSALTSGLSGKVSNATGQTLTLWKGTQAQYDAIASKDASTIYAVV